MSYDVSEQDVIITGVAINELNFENGISIFPNPVIDVLNISFELNTAQNVEVSLVTIDGKLVNATTHSNVSNVSTTINTTNLSTGMYILNITSDEGKFTSTLMVK